VEKLAKLVMDGRVVRFVMNFRCVTSVSKPENIREQYKIMKKFVENENEGLSVLFIDNLIILN
jgi:hypothetical protein